MAADEQRPDLEQVWEQLRTTSEPGTHRLRLDPVLEFNAIITCSGVRSNDSSADPIRLLAEYRSELFEPWCFLVERPISSPAIVSGDVSWELPFTRTVHRVSAPLLERSVM